MEQNQSRMSAGRGLPAGTLTFLFTDIEGSTKLQTELGTDRYQDVLETHTRILREAFQKDDGFEVRVEGDALFVVFPVAAKAVRATAAAQRALGAATFPHGATVRVRMGMHTGEGRPATADAGADYVGIDVNRAARVAAAGHGGQVLLTEATAPLAPISDPDLVPSTIAHTLGVQVSGSELPLPRLLDHLKGKRMLLVLDNFEQILPAAPIVGQLLGASSALKVIASSRAPLRISGEQEFPVPPLEVPDPQHLPTLDVLAQSDAVRLFVERAGAVRPDFRVTPENAAAVAEICNQLDGLPLAIELAAARVKVLTPQAMLPKLREGLDVLASTARDLPERQRTLRGAIAWSWDLLTPAECRLFSRLAVFVGGGMLQQVETICGPAKELGGDVLDALSSLVEHSLVRQTEVAGEPRFRMLVTIREFALERLAESEERDLLRMRHARAYLAFAEEARPHVQESDQRHWLDLLELEHDNLRAALESSIGDRRVADACRLVYALWRFWQVRGHLVEGGRWCERVLALPTAEIPPLVLMSALEASAGIAYWRGDTQTSGDGYLKAAEIARVHGDDAAQANAEYNLSFVYGIPGFELSQALDL